MGVVLFILASAIVGIRLLLLYRKLRQPPELFLGLGYLWAGTIGFGALLVGLLSTPKGQVVPEVYGAFSVLAGDIGTIFFYLFVWYVFRRESVASKVSLCLVAIIMVTSLVRDTWLGGVTFGPAARDLHHARRGGCARGRLRVHGLGGFCGLLRVSPSRAYRPG